MTSPRLLTTTAAAKLIGCTPNSVARWCRLRGVQPAAHVRDGRSTVTLWRERDLITAAARHDTAA